MPSLRLLSALAVLLTPLACDSAPETQPDTGTVPVEAWVTEGDGAARLAPKEGLAFERRNPALPFIITVDEAQTFQEIEGFGAAMTNASAYLLQASPRRAEILRALFSREEGIGVSYVRLPMGSSDFTAQPHYTYNDLPAGQTDPDLAQFSIEPDRRFIIPVLKEAHAIGPFKLMGSPWSAPAWMKTSKSLIGGALDPAWYSAYAQYFVRFLQAYAAEGLPIDAVTVQNEPLHEAGDYPSMRMEAAAQAAFIENHLGPALDQNGLDTKVLIYDHNWDRPDYPAAVLQDAGARAFIDGVAWHCYGGNVDAQSAVHQAYPQVGTYFTECTGSTGDDFGGSFVWQTRNLFIGAVRNWAKTVLLWNLVLNEQSGPHLGGCSNCNGIVTLLNGGSYRLESEYYVVGHFSLYVRPGARRIASTTQEGELETVAFRNADGSLVLVALNPGDAPRTFEVRWGDRHLTYRDLPKRSAVTLRWHPPAAP